MYATENRESDRARKGIVFKIVAQWECDAINQKIYNLLGPKRIAEHDTFRVPLAHLHIIDDSAVTHLCNRHFSESPQPHLPLTLDDLKTIPEVVDPRNIVEFCLEKGMPRIIYEKAFRAGSLVVVQEIQSKAGLAVKTAYRKR